MLMLLSFPGSSEDNRGCDGHGIKGAKIANMTTKPIPTANPAITGVAKLSATGYNCNRAVFEPSVLFLTTDNTIISHFVL